MVNKFKVKFGQFMLRLKTACTILFRPSKRWIILKMNNEELMKYYKGDSDFKINIAYHKFDTDTTLNILRGFGKNIELPLQKEDPLVRKGILGKERLN